MYKYIPICVSTLCVSWKTENVDTLTLIFCTKSMSRYVIKIFSYIYIYCWGEAPLIPLHTCADPEGGGQGVLMKNHKNIGFLSNTGQDPL